jgi:peptide/nickel transport system substrate-binding protein
MRVTIWSTSGLEQFARYATRVLHQLGYRSRERIRDDAFQYAGDPRNHAQALAIVWIADYPAASNFLLQLGCAAFKPGPANSNFAEFCEPRVDRLMDHALALQPTHQRAADAVWARVDRAIVDAAPWAPLVNPLAIDFTSRRVGDFQYSQGGALIDQLWVR